MQVTSLITRLAFQKQPFGVSTACVTKMLLLLLVLALPAVLHAQFLFVTNHGAITITGYTGPGGAVTIPAETNGLPVTSVGDHAFESQSKLSSIGIPNSVTNVGAFAFTSCTALTNAVVGESVVTIGSAAFSGCQSLTDITVPASVIRIGLQAFYYCTSLRAITVQALNAAYSSLDGVLFNHSRTALLQYPGGKTGAFTIPSTVTNIGDCAFMQCDKLAGVLIPASVTHVGGYAFYYCRGLTDVIIPASITSIGSLAFCGCAGITNLTIPASVSSIGYQALCSCAGLEAITVAESNLNYCSIEGVLLNKDRSVIIQCPGAKAGTYSVPNTVTNIASSAFWACWRLTGITLPDNVVSIGEFAFCLCTGLSALTIPESVASIGNYAFDASTNLTAVYFRGDSPADGYLPFYYVNHATVYYLPGTEGWGPVWGGVPTMVWRPRIRSADGSFGVQTNQFGFTISWASGMVVVVEACADLAGAVWSPLQTNTLTSDSLYFSDPDWTNYPTRFYRIRSP